MLHLIKLARAIRNANELLEASRIPKRPSRKKNTNYTSKKEDTSPTHEEQTEHESRISFKDKIDFSQEPSVEYLD
jgi:hypothetical protein